MPRIRLTAHLLQRLQGFGSLPSKAHANVETHLVSITFVGRCVVPEATPVCLARIYQRMPDSNRGRSVS